MLSSERVLTEHSCRRYRVLNPFGQYKTFDKPIMCIFCSINRQIEPNKTVKYTLPTTTTSNQHHTMNTEDAQWLFMQYQHATNILLIDCRTLNEYSKGHIEGAINLFVPPLMLRRLKKGNVPLTNFVNSEVWRIFVIYLLIFTQDSLFNSNELLSTRVLQKSLWN